MSVVIAFVVGLLYHPVFMWLRRKFRVGNRYTIVGYICIAAIVALLIMLGPGAVCAGVAIMAYRFRELKDFIG